MGSVAHALYDSSIDLGGIGMNATAVGWSSDVEVFENHQYWYEPCFVEV
jgi:hypothetical protein